MARRTWGENRSSGRWGRPFLRPGGLLRSARERLRGAASGSRQPWQRGGCRDRSLRSAGAEGRGWREARSGWRLPAAPAALRASEGIQTTAPKRPPPTPPTRSVPSPLPPPPTGGASQPRRDPGWGWGQRRAPAGRTPGDARPPPVPTCGSPRGSACPGTARLAPPEPPGTRTHRSAPLPRLPMARERRRGQSRSPGGGAALEAAEAPAGPRPGPGASPGGGARLLSPHPCPRRGAAPRAPRRAGPPRERGVGGDKGG